MKKTFKLEIVTPDKITFSGDVERCVLPGADGYFGVLPMHAPFVSVLGPGEATFFVEGRTEHLALSGGVAEVDPSKVRVLAETAELASEIDVQRAKAKIDAKGLEIKSTRMETGQHALIQASLIKQLVRMKVGEKYGQS